jgi:hypothetical protein
MAAYHVDNRIPGLFVAGSICAAGQAPSEPAKALRDHFKAIRTSDKDLLRTTIQARNDAEPPNALLALTRGVLGSGNRDQPLAPDVRVVIDNAMSSVSITSLPRMPQLGRSAIRDETPARG